MRIISGSTGRRIGRIEGHLHCGLFLVMAGLDPTIHAFFLLRYRPTNKTWIAARAAMTGWLAETPFTG